MTNAEALAVAEKLLTLAKELRGQAPAESWDKFFELYGRIRRVAVSLLPRQAIEVTGAYNVTTTHENIIEAGYLSGSGEYEYQGYKQLVQFVGELRERAERDPNGVADGQQTNVTAVAPFVDPARLDELRSLPRTKFDFARLIRMCEELNVAFASNLYHAVTLLTRAILDHVPPVFGKTEFAHVANNHGSKSFKDSMDHLDKSARKIADAHLHQHIRRSETLPNATQVNFSRDLDVLLAEVVRLSK